MKTQSRTLTKLLLLLISLFGLVDTAYGQRLTSRCVFEYDNKPYQWSRSVDDISFEYINDSGQAAAQNHNRDFPRIYFFDSNSFFGRQAATFTEFSSEYSAWIDMRVETFNNNGLIMGSIYLANPSPVPDHDFHLYSNGFAFGWDSEQGFFDVADQIGGVSGRGDIGGWTFISTLSGTPKLITEQWTTAGPGTQISSSLPFQVRAKENHITPEMLASIASQCGSAPGYTPNAQGNDSNANLEFINGTNIVRFPAANFGISTSHWWTNPEIYNGNTGNLGDGLNFRIQIDNFGALDIYSLNTTLEVVNQDTDEIIRLESYSDSGPTSVDAGQRSDYFYFFTSPLKPGTYPVRVVVKGLDEFNNSFEIASTTRFLTIVSTEPLLNANLHYTDDRSRSVVGLTETFGVTLDINATDGIHELESIFFTDLFANAPNLDVISAPTIPPEGFTILPNGSRSLEWTLKPNSGGNFRLGTTVSGLNFDGLTVSDSDGFQGSVISEDLTVEVTITHDATVDPEKGIVQEESIGEDPVPIEFKVDIEVCNNTTETITDVRLLNSSIRSKDGIALLLDMIEKISTEENTVPVNDVELGDLEKKKCVSLPQTIFVANDDVEIEIEARASAVSFQGATLTDMDEEYLEIKPKYLVEIVPEVINPADGGIIEAGVPIRISGTVKNLSNTHTLEMGPMYAVLEGNAGAQSFAWDADGTDPEDFIPPLFPMEIAPGDEREFSIRVTTAASDPRHDGSGAGKPTGGTRAYINLIPWAIAEHPDGERTPVKPDSSETYEIPDQLKNVKADIELVVSVDDSIAIPVANDAAIAAGITLGGIQAAYDVGAELLKAPYTVLNGFASLLWATIEYQHRLWDSFTEEEKAAFAEDTGLLAGTILYRHYEMANEIDPQALLDQVNAAVLEQMTDLAEEWELGDYTSVATTYSRHSTALVGEIVFPVALWKLGKYRKAQEVLQRAQAAKNARNRALLASANVGEDFVDLRRIEQILLTAESGVEATVDDIVKLFGYTPEEIGRLQATLDRYPGMMMTTRSKNARSVFWKEIFEAILKPEALKAKGVHWMDEVLGYPRIYDGYSSVGAMVFKKPDFMVLAEQSGNSWGTEILSFLSSKNIHPGDAMYDQAVERLLLRAEEWVKYEKTYKKADELGYLDLTFDTDFNSVGGETAALIRRGSTNEIPLGAKNHVGFRLRKISEPDSPFETYVMEMRDKQGNFRPVTGDVDNTGFTRTDSTALDELTHAKVLDDFYGQGLIEHGDSATAKPGIGGVDFIAKQAEGTGGAQELVLQWKAGEPGPRLVRFNKEKSVWNGPRDFRLHYDGGFVDVGNSVPQTGPKPPVNIPNGPGASVPAPLRKPQTVSAPNIDGSPNMGSCRLSYSADPEADAIILGSSGMLSNVGPDGTVTPSELHDICFKQEGNSIVSVAIAPSTELSADIQAGATILPVLDNGSAAPTSNASTVKGFEAGQTVVIGADTDHAEVRQITDTGPLSLDAPLLYDHEIGEVIVVVVPRDTTPPGVDESNLDSLDALLDSVAGTDGTLTYSDGLLHYSSANVGLSIKVNGSSPTTDGISPGIELTDHGELIIHTDQGQTIRGYAVLADSELLEQALAGLQLVFNGNAQGHLVVGAEANTGPVYLSMMPSLLIENAPEDIAEGVYFTPSPEVMKLELISLVSHADGAPKRQWLYPAPVDWKSLQAAFLLIGAEKVTIGIDGRIGITLGGEVHGAMMDYVVLRATGPQDETLLEFVPDVNGDGLPDILITYPDGNQQTMYYLGVP